MLLSVTVGEAHGQTRVWNAGVHDWQVASNIGAHEQYDDLPRPAEYGAVVKLLDQLAVE